MVQDFNYVLAFLEFFVLQLFLRALTFVAEVSDLLGPGIQLAQLLLRIGFRADDAGNAAAERLQPL